MRFFEKFKKFIARGDAVDMAVGLTVGASFTKIVDVLVGNVIMPPIGLLLGGIDFSSFRIVLKPERDGIPAVSIDYGLFLTTLINFLIVAAAIFILIQTISKIYRKEAPSAHTKSCRECKMSIPIDARRCGHCTSRCEPFEEGS